MLSMGDEVRRTQGGNNNAYCHDDEFNWFDWALVATHADIHRFVRLLVARRVLRDSTTDQTRLPLTEVLHRARTTWHGVKLLQPDWSPQSHSLAFGAEMAQDGLEIHLILNAYWEALDFELPAMLDVKPWRRWIDTTLDSPDDIVPWDEAPAVVDRRTYHTGPRSVVVLWRALD
jgi:glycogen operon protein